MERENNVTVARAMISYLKTWAMKANCLGFEHAKYSHACISTDMEDGLYTWLNREALTEARKNIITAPGVVREPRFMQEANSKINNNFKGNFSGGKRPEFRRANQGEKTGLPCYNYNEGKCQKNGDHETSNILWRHICVKCLEEGHVSKECTRFPSN
jgi:hypothetical protein